MVMGDNPSGNVTDSPSIHRLRGRTVKPESWNAIQERKRKKGKGKQPKTGNNPLGCLTEEEKMDQVLKRMDTRHEETQAKMAEMINLCKKDINENLDRKISSLTDEMKTVKSELKRIEKNVESDLDVVHTNVKKLEEKVDHSNSEIKKVEQLYKGEKEATKAKITNLEQEVRNEREKNEKEIGRLRSDLQTVMEENKKLKINLEGLLENIDYRINENVDHITVQVLQNKNDIREQGAQLESVDNKVRASNIVIDGLPEVGKFEITSREVGNLIRNLNPKFDDESIVLAYRLGKKKGKKPRTVVACFKTPNERDFVIGHMKEIKEKSGINSLWINRDQAESSKRRYTLLKTCYMRMMDQGHSYAQRTKHHI